MNAARIRIGRVRLKGGGADVRVFRRKESGHVISHIRDWFAIVANEQRAPDAYAAVALWVNPEQPGCPDYNAAYCTRSEALPPPVLCRVAAAYIGDEATKESSHIRTMHALGYEIGGYTPDDPDLAS